MTSADTHILEMLQHTDMILPPIVFAKNLDYSQNYMTRRCRKLYRAGLVDRVERGYYAISDKGRAYLDGDLDAEDLPDPDAEDKDDTDD